MCIFCTSAHVLRVAFLPQFSSREFFLLSYMSDLRGFVFMLYIRGLTLGKICISMYAHLAGYRLGIWSVGLYSRSSGAVVSAGLLVGLFAAMTGNFGRLGGGWMR